MAVLAHFVDNDGNLSQMLLGIDPIYSKTSIKIKESIKSIVFDKWKIEPKMIFRYISEAASPNICAFKYDFSGLLLPKT